MSRIETSLEQDAIADSLLGDVPESDNAGELEYGGDGLESRIADSLVSDEAVDLSDEPEYGEFDDQPEAPQQEFEAEQQFEQENALEQAEAQPVELSPQQIRESIDYLGAECEQLGLNDPSAAATLATELTVPFGQSPASVDIPVLGSTFTKITASALKCYE